MVTFTDQIRLKESITVRVKIHDKTALRTDKNHCAWPGCVNPVTAVVDRFPSCAEHVHAIMRLLEE